MRAPADRSHDVIIVGARVAGAATALLLARAGLKVLVIDRQPRGTDTLSTHALMRGGVQLLSRWGLLSRLLEAGTPLVATTTFHYGEESLAIPIRSDAAVPGLLAPRRTLLDLVLVEAAEAAGAEFRHSTALRAMLTNPAGRVVGVTCQGPDGAIEAYRAGLVVGADGIGSATARLVAARELRRGRHAAATSFGYFPRLGNSGFHWHYRKGMAAGVIPTNDGLSCVFVSVPVARFDATDRHEPAEAFQSTLAMMNPELAERVGYPALVPLSIFRGRPSYLREAHGPGWALVGDAGFFRDPLTAHGITDALRDAEALAAAVLRGTDYDLRRYQAERDEFAIPLLEVTDRIVGFGWELDELQAMHKELNQVMKAEVAAITARAAPQELAIAG